MKFPAVIPAAAIFALAACGGGTQTAAEQLEEAADQSDAAAAPILENAADQIEESSAIPAEAEAAAQQALQKAGNIQARTVDSQQQPAESMQAVPNRSGQQTPPPKVPTGPGDPATQAANSQ